MSSEIFTYYAGSANVFASILVCGSICMKKISKRCISWNYFYSNAIYNEKSLALFPITSSFS